MSTDYSHFSPQQQPAHLDNIVNQPAFPSVADQKAGISASNAPLAEKTTEVKAKGSIGVGGANTASAKVTAQSAGQLKGVQIGGSGVRRTFAQPSSQPAPVPVRPDKLLLNAAGEGKLDEVKRLLDVTKMPLTSVQINEARVAAESAGHKDVATLLGQAWRAAKGAPPAAPQAQASSTASPKIDPGVARLKAAVADTPKEQLIANLKGASAPPAQSGVTADSLDKLRNAASGMTREAMIAVVKGESFQLASVEQPKMQKLDLPEAKTSEDSESEGIESEDEPVVYDEHMQQKFEAAHAAKTPPKQIVDTSPNGKEEVSSKDEVSDDDLGDDSDDDAVVIESPGTFSKEKNDVALETPVRVSQSGVTKVEIQGGKDSAPISVKDLETKVEELKECKNFDERSNLLRQLTPGERQQVKQYISGSIMILNSQLSLSSVEDKELLRKQINDLKTVETQVVLSISIPEKIPKTSMEREGLREKNDLLMNDVVHYICDPCLYGTCKNETFSGFRENGISNETLMKRFVLSYCGFAKTEKVVQAIIEKFAEVSDNPSARKNLLVLLSQVLASSSGSVNESPEAKAQVKEMIENFTKAELGKPEAKEAFQTQLQQLAQQTKQSVPASKTAENQQENGLTLEQLLSPGKKSPQMIAEFASSLTSIQNRAYQSITSSEFFTTVGAVKSKEQPNISESVKLFNNITNVVVQAILQNSSKNRTEMIKFFIDLQSQLIKNGDFQSAYAIQAALNNAAVDRLDEMKKLTGEYALALEKNSKLFNPSRNFANLTAEIKERKSKGEFYLPLISLALMQLTNANEMPNPEDKTKVSPYKILQFGTIIETACESQSDKNKTMEPPKHDVRDALLSVNINPDDMYNRSLALQPRK